jgi:hypothetical protein
LTAAAAATYLAIRIPAMLRSESTSSTIRNTMEVAEQLMIQKVPYRIIKGSKGQIHDGFEMEIEALLIHVIHIFGLEEKTKGVWYCNNDRWC